LEGRALLGGPEVDSVQLPRIRSRWRPPETTSIRGAWLILPALLGTAVGPPAENETPTFPVETRVVALDVVVTGRDGRPLDDLRPDELQVLENGHPCEIRLFRLVRATPSGDRSAAEDTTREEAATPPSSASPPAFATPRRTNLIVLFFDRLTIEGGPLARQGALDFLARDFPKDTWFAVFSTVSRRFVVPFTPDLVAVRNGVEAATSGSTPRAGAASEAPSQGQQTRAGSEGTVPPSVAEVAGRSAALASSALQAANDLDAIYAIEGVARALEGLRGHKTILYFAEGWQSPLSVRPQYEDAISAATRANVTIHTFDARGLAYRKLVAVTPLDRVLASSSADHRGGPFGGRMTPVTDDRGTPAAGLAGPSLEELAEDTGGRAIANTNDLRVGLARISEELRHYYEIVYAPADPANDGRFRRISVKVSRPGVGIRTRKGYFATAIAVTARQSAWVAEEKTRPYVVPGDSAQAENVERRPPTPDASLVPVLEHAARYVIGYEEAFRNVVAEEVYSQSVFVGTPLVTGLVPDVTPGRGLEPATPAPLLDKAYRRRRTRADLVFVRLPGDVPWSLFRDVFEVDGRKVRDRDRRLQMLFEHPSPSALAQARRIVDEGARYNIGGAARTINVPTMPLVFLHPRNQGRFSFAKGGQRWISGVEALEIRFEEVVRPTVVTTSSGDSLPAHGSFWIDASHGAVLRSEAVFLFEPSLAEASVETDYELLPSLRLWVPVEMRERYRNLPHASRSVFGAPTEATAHYSNFRQFTVTVEDGGARLESPP
jgi:VWFA-related protein